MDKMITRKDTHTIEDYIKYVDNTKTFLLYFFDDDCSACNKVRDAIEQSWIKNVLRIYWKNNPDVMGAYWIEEIPTCIMINGGKAIDWFHWWREDISELLKWFASY